MQLDKLIAINQRVELTFENEKNKHHYPSVIQEVGSDTFTVDVPSKRHKSVIPPAGTTVEVNILTANGRYWFETQVIGKKNQGLPLLVLKIPDSESIGRVQRRQYVRVSVVMGVLAEEETEEREKEERITESRQGTALDISGGGMRLATDKAYQAGTRLKLSFTLDKRGFELFGLVRHCKEQVLPSKTVYLLGISFEPIDPTEQDAIVSYCFKRQLEMNKSKLFRK